MGITRGGKGQIPRSCGPGDTEYQCCHPQTAGATWPRQGTAAGTRALARAQRRDLRSLGWKPREHWGWGVCGEEWLGFQTHWFTEEPAREGQGAACLVIVITLITLAGSEQDPTLRQVPHHPLPGICATIPAEHPARPGPCCAPKVAPTRCPHPVRHPGSLLGSP